MHREARVVGWLAWSLIGVALYDVVSRLQWMTETGLALPVSEAAGYAMLCGSGFGLTSRALKKLAAERAQGGDQPPR